MTILALLFFGRVITTLICFGSGAPGGIFAPMLALGTLFGYTFGVISQQYFPIPGVEPGMLLSQVWALCSPPPLELPSQASCW
ncbi:H(+)/Cl(-) exchange transporter clcA [Vibrio ishigakensis]|uniref:H(+)/Cl(-) exchange transporter clcA n=1 Tax=Vibrio ishigakensis TaxID=1481914 RepID=A0A0B8PIF5_9VIBR|nr:H(+)/Cl(-) exchange transporter clcA [Vibrio ishigakensis]